MVHYGNIGMNCQLADVLTLGGLADNNVLVRYKMFCRKLQVSKEWNVPSKFDNVALHTNHLKLVELNRLAKKTAFLMYSRISIPYLKTTEKFFCPNILSNNNRETNNTSQR